MFTGFVCALAILERSPRAADRSALVYNALIPRGDIMTQAAISYQTILKQARQLPPRARRWLAETLLRPTDGDEQTILISMRRFRPVEPRGSRRTQEPGGTLRGLDAAQHRDAAEGCLPAALHHIRAFEAETPGSNTAPAGPNEKKHAVELIGPVTIGGCRPGLAPLSPASCGSCWLSL